MRTIEEIRKAEERDAAARRALAVRNALDDLIEAAEGVLTNKQWSVRHLSSVIRRVKGVIGKTETPDIWPGDPGFKHPQEEVIAE